MSGFLCRGSVDDAVDPKNSKAVADSKLKVEITTAHKFDRSNSTASTDSGDSEAMQATDLKKLQEKLDNSMDPQKLKARVANAQTPEEVEQINQQFAKCESDIIDSASFTLEKDKKLGEFFHQSFKNFQEKDVALSKVESLMSPNKKKAIRNAFDIKGE
jgi:hypothetical protein